MSGDVSLLLKDIEFGPVDRKVEAIGKLRLLPGVSLAMVQPALDKALGMAPEGSILKFYAASTLASLGDGRDLVADALTSLMSAEPFDGPGDTLIHFPWAVDKPKYLGVAYIRQFSPQIGVIEAFGQMRGNGRAAQALAKLLEHLDKVDWRLFTIFAAGANGHPSLRQQLEYLRDREPGSVEAAAAKVALEHFGTSTILEIAQVHASVSPRTEETKKSGCFIATAVYGGQEAPQVKILQEFRDQVLLRNRTGRVVVAIYYRVGPSVSWAIGRSQGLRLALKNVLIEPLVGIVARILNKKR